MVNRVEKTSDVGVKHPFHVLRHERCVQRLKDLMRASAQPKPVRHTQVGPGIDHVEIDQRQLNLPVDDN